MFRLCFSGGLQFALPAGETIIGRDSGAHLRVDDLSVSRRHARILVVQDRVTIEDIGSKNGIERNGHVIAGRATLADGDRLKVGDVEMIVRRQDAFEVQESTGIETSAYVLPTYRTCVACRQLLELDDETCPSCGAAQEPADLRTDGWTDAAGRRRAPRVGVRLRGLYVSATLTIEGEVSNLSAGGAFFACELLDEVGTPCDLLVMPEGGEVARFAGEVVRVADRKTEPDGVGLRFLKMTPAAQAWLKAIVDRRAK